MEITWNNIHNDEKIKLWHTKFQKMEIVKIIEKDENENWIFKGCYILNLKYNSIKELSDYHFYTINYFLDDGIKLMCIQPLYILDQNYKVDDEIDINNRIITWFNNCKQKFNTGYDVLGQRHGLFVNASYKNLQNEEEWQDITKYDENTQREIIKRNLDTAYDGLSTAFKLWKDEVVNIIIKSTKVSITDIFS